MFHSVCECSLSLSHSLFKKNRKQSCVFWISLFHFQFCLCVDMYYMRVSLCVSVSKTMLTTLSTLLSVWVGKTTPPKISSFATISTHDHTTAMVDCCGCYFHNNHKPAQMHYYVQECPNRSQESHYQNQNHLVFSVASVLCSWAMSGIWIPVLADSLTWK